jgi:hypothetical protein
MFMVGIRKVGVWMCEQWGMFGVDAWWYGGLLE